MMSTIYFIFGVAIVLGIAIGVARYLMGVTMEFLGYFDRDLRSFVNKTWAWLIELPKTLEYIWWKYSKLPKLKILTRQGDLKATAERISRSEHKAPWTGDKKHEY